MRAVFKKAGSFGMEERHQRRTQQALKAVVRPGGREGERIPADVLLENM